METGIPGSKNKPNMKLYLLVFFSQALFNILKTYEIKFTYENKLRPLLLNAVGINLVSLLTLFYSIDSLLNRDYVLIPIYILGTVVGKWISMKGILFLKN